MKNITLYHNPRCSKSRQTLALLEEHGIEPQIIEYLKMPLSAKQLTQLIKLLKLTPRELLRRNEDDYKQQNLQNNALSDKAIIQAMSDYPKLIERPIVVIDDKKAALGRPPENVLTIL